MNLPKIQDAKKYIGLYIVDFGETSSVGFTADEVAELLESRQFADIKVYKILNAWPDGRMEFKGICAETFQLEMGMFFYSASEQTCRQEYNNLVELAEAALPPCRVKVELSKISEEIYTTAIIFPAEYNDQMSSWLIDIDYKTSGMTSGGISAVTSYYQQKIETVQTGQLNAAPAYTSRTGSELMNSVKQAVQR